MTFTDVSDVGRPIVLVPIGSFEQHGPHLPPDTDTVIAVAICRETAARHGGGPVVVVTPPIGISASGEHAGFTATLSIGTRVLADVIVEIARSADWAEGVVFVNGHGGNLEALESARRVIESEGRRVRIWSPTSPAGGDAHAGHVETSVMLAIAPDAVNMSKAVAGNTAPLADMIAPLRTHGVRGVSTNGVLGDPTRANATTGRGILDEWVADLSHIIERL